MCVCVCGCVCVCVCVLKEFRNINVLVTLYMDFLTKSKLFVLHDSRNIHTQAVSGSACLMVLN